ncbi:structural maintenance of chromosomes protein 3-like [Mytilus edulis]|uniref:structural maintenance of chromosomes protein 3-like n=1 Tax=Mytilus edulis TaxID=6550 RepID=UPI0039F0588B
MEPNQVRALHNCHRDLLRDLEVDRSFLLSLYIDNIITEEQKNEIMEEKSRRGKCAKLLEIIPRRGPRCFPTFVSKIRKDYSWIAEKLDKELTKERKNLPKDVNDKLTEVINNEVCPMVYGCERNIITPSNNHPGQTVGRLSEMMTALKYRSLRALEMSTKDKRIEELSLPGLISRKVQSLHDDVNGMKTELQTERKKIRARNNTDDQKVNKDISKLTKDLKRQKESNKKMESSVKNKDKKISSLQNFNLHLEKENLDLKARLEELEKSEKPLTHRYGSATTHGSQGITTISELFDITS